MKTKAITFCDENHENESFIEKIDKYSQPNKLKKDLIHNQIKENDPTKLFKGCKSNNNISYKIIAQKNK